MGKKYDKDTKIRKIKKIYTVAIIVVMMVHWLMPFVVGWCPYILLGNGYITLKEGMINLVEESRTQEELNERVLEAVELNQFAKNMGIPFLYIHPPLKSCQYDLTLKKVNRDFTNENISEFIQLLKKEQIDCLDLRINLHEDYEGCEGHYNCFYKTDHHWTFDAGFWACNEIEDEIETRYNMQFDKSYNDRNMFETRNYKDAMYGSYGHAVEYDALKRREDFSILFPAFETEFRMQIQDKKIDCTGSFEEVFINYAALDEVVSAGGGYAYETVLYGNPPLVQIDNLKNKRGPKVLIIRDSFAIAVAPYLILGCSELDLIDVRPNNGNYTGNVKQYIVREQPDIVIMMLTGMTRV